MFVETKVNFEVLQLKNNCIPKGLIPLENFFDKNYAFKSPRMQADDEEVETCNLGTTTTPQMVKLSKFLSMEMKQKYIEMMKKYIDVFSWS